jgi:hypothetical protein
MIVEDIEVEPIIEEVKSVEIQEELVEESEVFSATPVFNKYKANRKNYK